MASKAIIQAIDLTKVYRNGVELKVMDSVSLAIQEGVFPAITGPSGSGKSTLLNLNDMMDAPTEGKILVNGIVTKRLRGNNLADFRLEHIGFVCQVFNLISALLTLENVMLLLIPYRRRLDFNLEEQPRNLLVSFGLENRLHHLPSQLSGTRPFQAALEEKLLLTRYFYQEVQKIDGVEVGNSTDLSIAIFRAVPGSGDANAFNQKLIQAIQQDGRIYLSSTTLEGKIWIRMAILSFRTHLDMIDQSLTTIRNISSSLVEDNNSTLSRQGAN